ASDAVETVAVPLVRPLQSCQRDDEIDRQHPGADHRVQIPQERAALQSEVRDEPRPEAARGATARPTQIESCERHEDEQQRARADDLRADVAIANFAKHKPAMQLTHVAKESLSAARRS